MKQNQKSRALSRMKTRLDLRGLRPSTVENYLRYARRFLEAVDKAPGRVTQGDVEQHLLVLYRAGRSVSTRNGGATHIREKCSAKAPISNNLKGLARCSIGRCQTLTGK